MNTRYIIKNGKISRLAEIVIKKDGMQIISPSEELILTNGLGKYENYDYRSEHPEMNKI